MPKGKNILHRKLLFFALILLFVGIGVIVLNKYLKKKSAEISDVQKYFPKTSVKVSVINGCGIDFSARYVKNFIIDNYKKVYVIFAKNIRGKKYNFNKTVIVVRKKGREKKLKYLQALTGITRRIYAYSDEGNEEFYIILGRDYKKYFSKKE